MLIKIWEIIRYVYNNVKTIEKQTKQRRNNRPRKEEKKRVIFFFLVFFWNYIDIIYYIYEYLLTQMTKLFFFFTELVVDHIVAVEQLMGRFWRLRWTLPAIVYHPDFCPFGEIFCRFASPASTRLLAFSWLNRPFYR